MWRYSTAIQPFFLKLGMVKHKAINFYTEAEFLTLPVTLTSFKVNDPKVKKTLNN